MALCSFRSLRLLRNTTFYAGPSHLNLKLRKGLTLGPGEIHSNSTAVERLPLLRNLCSSSHVSPVTEVTVGEAIQRWTRELNDARIPESENSLRHIVSSVLGCPVDLVHSRLETRLNQEQLDELENMVLCRLSRMPVQYIIKEWDFLDMTLKMMPPVFIPRPETESLVLLASKHVPTDRPITCLEVGCGSGAISLALLKRHINMTATAIDANPLAVALTKANAEILQLDQRLQVLQVALDESGWKPEEKMPAQKYDMIVSNPPYIATSEIASLAPEITLYEDYKALDGGPDGLRIVRLILKMAPTVLKAGGTLVLEVDPRQTGQIEKEASKAFRTISCHEDCFGVARLLVLKL